MSGITTSYTTVAVIPVFPVTARVTNAAVGLYTCPAGKKAIVREVSLNLDAVGADTTYAVAVKRGGTYFPIGAHAAPNEISTGQTTLEAGDILTNIGNAGSTNGTCDMDAIIQEVSVLA